MCVLVLGSAGAARAQTLAWDAPNDPSITGYSYKTGTQSGVYSTSQDVGNVTSTALVGLAWSTTYYFVVESYNAQGVLSAPSSEIVYTTPPPPLTLMCPAPMAMSSDGGPVPVALPVTVSGGLSPIATSCSPLSGALFPVGSTPFTCTATDAAVHTASCQSTVKVTACTYGVSPTSQAAGAASGTGTSAVTTAGSCAWSATSNASWLTLTAGASGTGNGAVSYAIAANTGTTARTGTLAIAGQMLTVTQSGTPCSYGVTPASQAAEAGGSSGTATVTTTGSCGWTATSNAGWLTLTAGASGTGNGTVGYTIAANTGAARAGTLTIAGQTLTVTQSGAQCGYSLSLTSQQAGAGAGMGSVTVATTTSSCAWTAGSNVSWLTVTSGASGTGGGKVSYSIAANTGASRTGTLTIAGQTLTVQQSGATTTSTHGKRVHGGR